MSKTAYPYTLQPVAYELSSEEQRAAQMSIWKETNKISKKVWMILAAIAVIAVAGLILVKNYSTIIFWLMLVGIVIYLLARTVGLKWYVKRELAKQPIEDVKGIRMGVQMQGLVVIQRIGAQEGRGVIAWNEVIEWQDNPEFIFLTYRHKGQQGAHILPKRMNSQNFSFDTIRKHLRETVGAPK